MTYLIVDAHEDLAYNMITFGRDYSLSAHEIRRREVGGLAVQHNDDATLGWPEFQKGRVAFVFSTIFAAPASARVSELDVLSYSNTEEAHHAYMRQLDTYDRLFDEHPDKFTPIQNKAQMEATLARWQNESDPHPTGLVTLMEGADGVRTMDELEEWWQRGVRIIGPAWKATRFCGGTREPGPLTKEGYELLDAMAPIGFILDLSHMAWEAAPQALDRYEGPIIASHANALKQVKNGTINRFLTDEIIEGIIEHDGVIGVVPYNAFLVEGWKISDTRSACPLDMVAAQIDYICQKAGNARHAGFGSDFDGGFGLQRIPEGLDTIADLQMLAPLLEARGYSQTDIAQIFGGNWIDILRRNLPA